MGIVNERPRGTGAPWWARAGGGESVRFSKGDIVKMVILAFMFTLVLSFIAPIPQAICAGVIGSIMFVDSDNWYDRDP
jgi:ABC-type dipeptide/oligopeptide/nickel transport system permease component